MEASALIRKGPRMTPQEARTYVRHLKETYPNPMSGQYCVGGIFCQDVGNPFRFPPTPTLFRVMAENITSPEGASVDSWNKYLWSKASEIVNHNDNGRFDSAWNELEAALSGEDYDEET